MSTARRPQPVGFARRCRELGPRVVYVYRAPTAATRLRDGDRLRWEDKLDGFTLPVRGLFERDA
ncbi:MAG: hypothetical protein RMM58_01430 [Chloroflexota bacterium]|nr:hypothetical protein [Dehalococcoidia bacterium]MDW8252521.1 hypothetical protein [Chloroflexota bacterium]